MDTDSGALSGPSRDERLTSPRLISDAATWPSYPAVRRWWLRSSWTPARRIWRYPQLERQQPPDVLRPVLAAVVASSMSVSTAWRLEEARLHELALHEHVVDELKQVAPTHARSGAENDALGRSTTLWQPLPGSFLEGVLLRPAMDLLITGQRERCGKTIGSTKGTRTSVEAVARWRGRYARLSPGRKSRESARTHPVGVVGESVVAVDRSVLVDHGTHVRAERRAHEPGQLGGVVERVAATEGRLFG